MSELIEKLDIEKLFTAFVAYLPSILAALLVLAVFWLVFRVASPPLRSVLRRAGFHPTLVRMLVDSLFRFTLLIVAVVMAAAQLGIDVAAALAGLGVAGIAVGLAAQDSLANLIAGFLIFWDKPFVVNDWVTVADQYGEVREITMRTTRIRTKNNTYVVIPNKKIIDEILVNHSKHGETRIEVPVGIAYKEHIPAAREAILAALHGIQGIIEEPAPDVVVTELGGSSVNMNVRVWIDDASLERPVFFRTLEIAKLALDAAGIEIPYPHLQLFVENIEDRVWDKAATQMPKLTAQLQARE